jgi:hypothetical protein
MQTNQKRVTGYWVATGLVAAALLAGGIAEVTSAPSVVMTMSALGYPPYFVVILGIWKVLSVPALLSPRLPRLKEWAYAGIFFDLTGGAASHLISGDPLGRVATPLVLLLIAAASWALRPPSRTLGAHSRSPESAQARARSEDVVAPAWVKS